MKYQNYDLMWERHNQILAQYKENIPVYSRGTFKNLLRLCLFLAWCVAWIESALRYYGLNYVDFDKTNPNFYLMSLLVLAVSVAVFKPYRMFTDKNCFGKIEKIERETEVGQAAEGSKNTKGTRVHRGGARIRFVRREVFVLTIRKNNGKTVEKKLTAFHNFHDVYKIGSSVSVIVGIKLPIPMDADILCGNHFCTKCGSFEPIDFRHCALCHNRLWYKNIC